MKANKHYSQKETDETRDLTMFSMDNWKVVICLMISLSRFTSFTHCAKSWKHTWMNYRMFPYDKMNCVNTYTHLLSWHQVLCGGCPSLSGQWCASPAPAVTNRQIIDELGKCTCMGATQLHTHENKTHTCTNIPVTAGDI